MSNYWDDFLPAMRTTRLGDCTDDDPELAAAWLGWQARDAEVDALSAKIVELEKSTLHYQHQANEWADAATNGPQWIKNIRDGISTVDEALVAIKSDIDRCRRLSK